MSVKSSPNHSLGRVARAFDLLVSLAGNGTQAFQAVLACFQRIVDDPVYRRQVWQAMTGNVTVTEITSSEWVGREIAAIERLELTGDEESVDYKLAINAMAETGQYGPHHYFVPAGLTRKQLIELARGLGIKINSSPPCDGQELPTEVGVLECDLAAMMQSTDGNHRPFNLNAEEHNAWAVEQGGNGLTSAEQTLYLVIRHFMAFGRILFMGGWIRCCNSHGADYSLGVVFGAEDGLGVFCGGLGSRSWRWGAVSRKFLPLAPWD